MTLTGFVGPKGRSFVAWLPMHPVIRPTHPKNPLKKGTGTSGNVVLRAWDGVGLGASPLFQRTAKGHGRLQLGELLGLLFGGEEPIRVSQVDLLADAGGQFADLLVFRVAAGTFQELARQDDEP